MIFYFYIISIVVNKIIIIYYNTNVNNINKNNEYISEFEPFELVKSITCILFI